MSERRHTIEEIRDVWLQSRGAEGSNWEQALGAVYDLGARQSDLALGEVMQVVTEQVGQADSGLVHWDKNLLVSLHKALEAYRRVAGSK